MTTKISPSHTFAHIYGVNKERKKDNNNKHKKDRYNGIKGMNRCDSPLTVSKIVNYA